MNENEKVLAYVHFKLFMVLFVLFMLILGWMFGFYGVKFSHSDIALLLVSLGTSLLLYPFLRAGKLPAFFLHVILIVDLIAICAALYVGGGIENSRWFLPVVIIFASGYIFNLQAAAVYAVLSFMIMTGVFALESYDLIPHYSIYKMPFVYFKDSRILMDYSLGTLFLYLLGALMSGYFNRVMTQTTVSLKESLNESKDARQISIQTREELMRAMEDLTKIRDELELRVHERTSELEEVKNNLENKVAERTQDLEQSRKAILHMMRDLKEDVEKLKEVDRMKGEFISIVSHELRTPLTPLMDYASILLEGIPGPATEGQKEIFNSMLRLSKRELTLVNSLLEISRLEMKGYTLNKIPLQLKPIILDSLLDIQKEAEKKNVILETDIDDNIITVLADENLITRLIAQLLNNALKFMPDGGKIKVSRFKENDQIRVEVADTGVGIAKENLEKIFEKFYQADSSYSRKFGGMGLGLAICKQIVATHGGKIWAESEGVGRGAKFIFTLPLN